MREGYETGRRMLRRHDPTYYLATRRLPRELRPATHALYGYVRTADQIVDGPHRPPTPAARRAALDAWEAELHAGRGAPAQPVVRALADAGEPPPPAARRARRPTCARCGSTARPVRISSWEELVAYMDGSAGSVGRIMAPLLGVPAPHADLGRLGLAFQLANFIRDVGEDRRLDRVYLPGDDRAASASAETDLSATRGRPRAARAARPRGRPRPRAVRVGRARRGDRRRASVRPGVRIAIGLYGRMLDRVEAAGFDVLGRRARRARVGPARRGGRGRCDEAPPRCAATSARRSTARADVLICGASFAGLAVARELAGSGADVLVVDRYEIGERATSACAAPTPWLHAMGVERAIRQEIPCMALPHAARLGALPAALELVELRLPRAVPRAVGAVRRALRDREGGGRGRRDIVHTDRGDLTAPLIVDALGWRRVLGARRERAAARGARSRAASRSTRTAAASTSTSGSTARSSATATPGRCPARGEQRVGVGSYEPRHHVKEPTKEIARRLDVDAVRYQGNWFPHRLRPAAEDGVFFVGDSAGHCFPLSGEGIRTAFYFGIAAGREIRAVLAGEKTPRAGARRLRRASRAATRRAFGWALCAPASDPPAAAAGADRAADGRWAASARAGARSPGTWSRRTRGLSPADPRVFESVATPQNGNCAGKGSQVPRNDHPGTANDHDRPRIRATGRGWHDVSLT